MTRWTDVFGEQWGWGGEGSWPSAQLSPTESWHSFHVNTGSRLSLWHTLIINSCKQQRLSPELGINIGLLRSLLMKSFFSPWKLNVMRSWKKISNGHPTASILQMRTTEADDLPKSTWLVSGKTRLEAGLLPCAPALVPSCDFVRMHFWRGWTWQAWVASLVSLPFAAAYAGQREAPYTSGPLIW